MKEILCIVGPSGSGKSMAQSYISTVYDVPLIESYTTRPMRNKDEGGHSFVDNKYYESVNEDEMIAYTNFGGFHYWCEKKDVKSKNIYVIDEDGLEMLKENFKDEYTIYSLKVNSSNEQKRLRGITPERIARDDGKFKMTSKEFDFVVNNNHSSFYFTDALDAIIHEIGFNNV